MQYVYVGGGANDLIDRAITRQTKFALVSLIEGFRKKDFGLHTTADAACDIEEFNASHIASVDGKIAIDSGGYSFIVGDKDPCSLQMMIDCYSVYLESEVDNYDYIFSLDIPFSKKYEYFNTVGNVYAANKQSLAATVGIMDVHRSLSNKFFFVWHFKMREQFIIWKHLYSGLNLDQVVRNHAIGGLVGLKEATRIHFAPFTGVSYYILNRHVQGPFWGCDYRMHFLGVYTKPDRFHIAFLEKLFNGYLRDSGIVAMSYDSINPIHTVRMNASVPLYCTFEKEFEIYPSLLDAPENVIRNVFGEDNHIQTILDEIDRRRNGMRLENSASLSPLNVFSNLQLDKFYKMIIDEYDLTGELHSATSPINLAGRFNRIFNDIEKRYPKAFSPRMKSSIALSLERTWYWHRWFVGKRDDATLDLYMTQEIQAIGFTGRLN